MTVKLTPKEAQLALIKLNQKITLVDLQYINMEVLGHPQFLISPGAQDKHHAYLGGLAVHIYEVTNYAYEMSNMFPKVDTDVIITAGIWHDFMKIKEYTMVFDPIFSDKLDHIEKRPYHKLVRHVAGSYAAFVSSIENYNNIPEEKYLGIQHALLSHHGRFEWGSPIEPQTLEAEIIHFADMFSWQYGPGVNL